MNVKIIVAALLTFVLAIILFAELIIGDDLVTLPIRIGALSLVLIFGILLVKSAVSEAKQRVHLLQVTMDLKSANVKLTQLDRVRSEFLSFASHQVKAPMSVVKGYAQLIADGTFGKVPEKVVETSKKIKESADRLVILVNNLLDLRRIEEGRMEFSPERTDVGLLLSQTIDDLQTLADRKQLRLTYIEPGHELPASLDINKFRQVIQNLVENSIKYTEKGWITVSAKRADGMITIQIADSGRGMSPQLIPELFEQFTRERDASKRIEGTGLGLYIAKQIVLGHHGAISAASEGIGKGSIFTVTVPVVT